MAAEWHPVKNSKILNRISPFSGHKVWWICSRKNHEWEAKVIERYSNNKSGCPECAAHKFQSSAEKEVVSYLCKLLGEEKIKTQVRSILKRQELDIYIPEHKVAIEYNGVYWHSEKAGKDRNYHFEKWKSCQDLGIRLIQIWEDQWLENPELVKRMIAQSLGKTPNLNPEKLVTELSAEKALSFFLLNSFNTKVTGNIKLALKVAESGDIAAVIVLKRQKEGLCIVNFASIDKPAEDLKTLLLYVEKTYSPAFVAAIIDNCTGESTFFAKSGFTCAGRRPLDYRYSKNKQRVPRKEYTIERFKTDPALKFEINLSERELADLNGLNRIWDAGKTKWVKELRTSNSLG